MLVVLVTKDYNRTGQSSQLKFTMNNFLTLVTIWWFPKHVDNPFLLSNPWGVTDESDDWLSIQSQTAL